MKSVFIMVVDDESCFNCIYYEKYMKECYFLYDNGKELVNDCFKNLEDIEIDKLKNM